MSGEHVTVLLSGGVLWNSVHSVLCDLFCAQCVGIYRQIQRATNPYFDEHIVL